MAGPFVADQGAAAWLVASRANAGPVVVPETEVKVRRALRSLRNAAFFRYESPLPAYERVIGGVLSRPPPILAGEVETAGRPGSFGEYAVETVNPDVIRQWMHGHEEDLAWRFLREPGMIRGVSRLATAGFVKMQSSRLSSGDWEELVRKDVLVPASGSELRFAAFCFKVLKSDGRRWRLIWSGVSFNDLFQRPPPFKLASVQELVDSLLGLPGQRLILSADLRSWFVQLPPHPWLRRFFGTRLGDRFAFLSGIPMGWSYAPFIAQKFSEAIAHRLSSLFRKKGVDVFFVVWIDNLVASVEVGRLSKEEIEAVFAQVSRECGAVWKEVELEAQVEVLGIAWDAVGRRWRLKEEWARKVVALYPQRGSASVYRWWTVAACVVRAVTVWLEPFCRVASILEWLGALSKRLAEGSLDWDSEVVPWAKALECFNVMMARIAENCWMMYRFPGVLAPVYGVSDASNAARAWAFHDPTGMFLTIRLNQAERHINEWELSAALEGIEAIGERREILWWSDSGVAVWALQKFYTKIQGWNPRLETVWRRLRDGGSRLQVLWKGTDVMEMDDFSRPQEKLGAIVRGKLCLSAPPCGVHTGEGCPEFMAFLDRAKVMLAGKTWADGLSLVV